MKTKLMLATMLAYASIAQAGPPISPAKIKKPLHLSQVKSLFRKSEPSAPEPQATACTATAGAASTAAPSAAASASSKKVHVRPFLNHPVTAPGPK